MGGTVVDILAVVLVIGFLILALTSALVHREYQRVYARRYRDIPAPWGPWTGSDRDPEVEGARRWDLALQVLAIVVVIVLVAVLANRT